MDRRTFLKTASIGIPGAIPVSRKQSSNLASLKTKSALLDRFSTPASVQDLQGSERALLNELWHINLSTSTTWSLTRNSQGKITRVISSNLRTLAQCFHCHLQAWELELVWR